MNKQQIKQAVTKVMQENPDAEAIKNVSLFGSFLSGATHSNSDVDLLFETREPMSLFQLGGLQYRLQEKLGRTVDFVPKKSIISQLKEKIISEAELLYERK